MPFSQYQEQNLDYVNDTIFVFYCYSSFLFHLSSMERDLVVSEFEIWSRQGALWKRARTWWRVNVTALPTWNHSSASHIPLVTSRFCFSICMLNVFHLFLSRVHERKGSGSIGVRDCSREGGRSCGGNPRARSDWSGTLRGTRRKQLGAWCVPLPLS